MATRPMRSRPVCGYCHQVAPSANHTQLGDFPLCTDGGTSSCHAKFLRLQKAKNEVLRVLYLGDGICEDFICAERVANTTRLSTLRRLVEALIHKVILAANELRRRATWFAGEIFARLRRAAELVGLQAPQLSVI